MNDFRPKEIKFLDKNSASNYLKLAKIIDKLPITFVFGAGVSASLGLPVWEKFLERICITYFSEWIYDVSFHRKKASFENPVKNSNIWLTDKFDMLELDSIINKAKNQDITDELIEDSEFYETISRHEEIPSECPPLKKSVIRNIDKVNETDDFIKKNMKLIIKHFMNNDILLIAQMVKNCVKESDWIYLLRKCLYNSYEEFPFEVEESLLSTALIKLIKNKKVNITSILNYNYDNIFELLLKENNLAYSVEWREKTGRKKQGFKVYHPHGYLPLEGGCVSSIILSEEDYQNESFNTNNWSNHIQNICFSKGSCIFIGVSMTDPNLRRLLKISSSTTEYKHFVFLPSEINKNAAQMMYDALFNHDLQRLGVECIRYPLKDEPESHFNLCFLLKLLDSVANNKLKLFK